MRINHLGISGGKDSTALLLWAVHESGYPKESIRATFCDTGNECEETYDYVRMLSETVHPIEWLTPEMDFYELAKHKGRFPSATVRFCTVELKLKPSKAYITDLMFQGFEVVGHTGIRASESADRAKMEPYGLDDYYGIMVHRPLLKWSLADVWAMHEKYGIPPNPLYAMGAKRVGCLPCIMSNKLEIRRMSERFPDRFDRIRACEGTTHLGLSTFFAPDKVPRRFRSKEVLGKRKNGMVRIAMIDDVIRWSKTGYRAEESGELFEYEEPSSCSHTSGACE